MNNVDELLKVFNLCKERISIELACGFHDDQIEEMAHNLVQGRLNRIIFEKVSAYFDKHIKKIVKDKLKNELANSIDDMIRQVSVSFLRTSTMKSIISQSLRSLDLSKDVKKHLTQEISRAFRCEDKLTHAG